ncbi:hypothetical protein GOP47_0017925 [Adiantum capillus-veneris]|uniref:Uncharacterized protein n=1 Tax=Adiantum capillus-veneris TaxID=13818 RepID=A0A9D4UGS2_ADICA|nr:hypothetical protein GOP47_0017925 [Adiantum capillus-veneris]
MHHPWYRRHSLLVETTCFILACEATWDPELMESMYHRACSSPINAPATVHANSYTYDGAPHLDDDDNEGDDDTKPAHHGYGHEDKSRGRYGKPEDDDDDDDDEEGYEKSAPKKNDRDKDVNDKPTYEKGGKPDEDDDDNEDYYGGKYGHGKPEHDDDDDDDDDDDEHSGGYGKPSKDDGKYWGGYGKPKKDEKDDGKKYGKDKPKDDDECDGKGPKKDDKGHPGSGYDKPEKEPRGNHGKDDKHPTPYPSKVVPKSISVEGVVSCQNCKYVGSDSLTNAKPISGAKVKLVCQTGPRYKSFFYATATTDSNGFFLISVPHFNFKKTSPIDDCVVFWVSSPLKECSTATDINMGKTGGPLESIPTFASSENLMFSVGPFAFAPKKCSSKPPPAYTPEPAVPAPKPGQSPPPYDGGSHY